MKAVVILGFLAILTSTLALVASLEYRHAGKAPLQGTVASLEYRQAGKAPPHRTGIINVMEKVVAVLQSVLAFLDGETNLDKITGSLQDVFIACEDLVNVKGIIGEVPFIGPTIVWAISPVLDIFGTLVHNTPVFGGLLSQFIVGPSYPTNP